MNVVKKTINVISGTSFKVPHPDTLDGMIHRTRFTPDLIKIEEYQYQRLFVYDELMDSKAGWNNAILGRHGETPTAVKMAHAAYTEDLYVLWKKRLGTLTYPVAMHTSEPSRKALDDDMQPMQYRKHIKGQLWLIRSYKLIDIDIWKENGVQFRRRRVDLIVPFRKISLTKRDGPINTEFGYTKIQAWMYVGLQDYWHEFIDDGYHFSVCKSFKPKKDLIVDNYLGDYYYFSTMEFND